MIKIEPVRPFIKVNNIRKSNDLKNENTDSKITTLYGIPKSYISFKSEKESNVKLSEEGQLFVERAKNIAKEKNCTIINLNDFVNVSSIDGIHYDENAHKTIAKILQDYFLNLT